MWIVTRDWGMESDVDFFETEESAKEFFEEWTRISDARMYLAKVIYEKESDISDEQ